MSDHRAQLGDEALAFVELMEGRGGSWAFTPETAQPRMGEGFPHPGLRCSSPTDRRSWVAVTTWTPR